MYNNIAHQYHFKLSLLFFFVQFYYVLRFKHLTCGAKFLLNVSFLQQSRMLCTLDTCRVTKANQQRLRAHHKPYTCADMIQSIRFQYHHLSSSRKNGTDSNENRTGVSVFPNTVILISLRCRCCCATYAIRCHCRSPWFGFTFHEPYDLCG